MAEISPFLIFGIVIMLAGLIILSVSLAQVDRYRIEKIAIPWWFYTILAGGAGIFLLGLMMIVLDISGRVVVNDVTRNVTKNVTESFKDILVKAKVIQG